MWTTLAFGTNVLPMPLGPKVCGRLWIRRVSIKPARLVYADTEWSVADEMAKDPELANAVDVIGVHYPQTAPTQTATAQGKSLWASEMWDLNYVNDYEGALVLAENLNQHALWGLSSSIVWNLIFSWYAILPFSVTDEEKSSGFGHSLLTASEPWSGHYFVSPTLYSVAHHTQFATPGWSYVELPTAGSGLPPGVLPSNGSYVVLFDPFAAAGSELAFSLIAQTRGSSENQTVDFRLSGLGSQFSLPSLLYQWQTTEQEKFRMVGKLQVDRDGKFSATFPPDAMVSLTSTMGQNTDLVSSEAFMEKGSNPPPTPFPFPYADDFEGYAQEGYAKYFCDEGGVWVVKEIPSNLLPPRSPSDSMQPNPSGQAYVNVVTQPPIAWETNPNPYSLIGNFNGRATQKAWTSYVVSADLMISPQSPSFLSLSKRRISSKPGAVPTTGDLFLMISARINSYTRFGAPPNGFNFYIVAPREDSFASSSTAEASSASGT